MHRIEHSTLLNRLPELSARWREGEIDAPAFAALYFLWWQITLHGEAFAARKRKSDPRASAADWLSALEVADAQLRRKLLLEYLGAYQFHSIIANVSVALVEWLRGAWALELRESVPDSLDVLRAQAHGTRPVTVITAYPRALQPVLTKENAFAFFVHDLEHAYKFFHSPALCTGQQAFFQSLLDAFEGGVFARYFDDPVFVDKFRYLMSDMNTHPEHSRQYLRAIVIEFHLRREGKLLHEALSVASEREANDVMDALSLSPLQY